MLLVLVVFFAGVACSTSTREAAKSGNGVLEFRGAIQASAPIISTNCDQNQLGFFMVILSAHSNSQTYRVMIYGRPGHYDNNSPLNARATAQVDDGTGHVWSTLLASSQVQYELDIASDGTGVINAELGGDNTDISLSGSWSCSLAIPAPRLQLPPRLHAGLVVG
jgi:hypothetical protein